MTKERVEEGETKQPKVVRVYSLTPLGERAAEVLEFADERLQSDSGEVEGKKSPDSPAD